MTPASDVLTDPVRFAAAVTQEPQQESSRRGDAPPPPPAPAPGNVDPRVIRDQIKALNRQKRDAHISGARSKLQSTNPRYFWWLGGAVALATGALLWNNMQSSQRAFQRDTALALAQAAGRGQEQPAAAPIAESSGVPNPLDQLHLSAQAAWTIGASFRTNDRGEAVGFTPLPPKRSATVLVDLLDRVDLCTIYVGLSDKAEVVIADEPTTGFAPLLDPSECGANTLVPTPQDPMPTTSTTAHS